MLIKLANMLIMLKSCYQHASNMLIKLANMLIMLNHASNMLATC